MKLTKTQNTLCILLAIFLVFTGVSHLSFERTAFLAQVPNWLPMQPDMVVLLSGVVEIVLGGALLFLPKHRVSVGWLVALFLAAVFPGNIAQLVNHNYAFGLNSDVLLWLRLPFQPLLIVLVLWSTGAWEAWRNKVKSNHQVYPITP